MSELEHTIEVKRGLLMRLFLWNYKPPLHRLNTCWLFWGFLLMPLTLPVFSFIRLLGKLIGPLMEASAKRSLERDERDGTVDEAPKEARSFRFLSSVAEFMGKVWWKIQPALPWMGGAVGVGLLAFLTYLAINNPAPFLKLLLIFGVGLVTAVILLALALGVGALTKNTTIRKAGRSVHNHTCANIRIKD